MSSNKSIYLVKVELHIDRSHRAVPQHTYVPLKVDYTDGKGLYTFEDVTVGKYQILAYDSDYSTGVEYVTVKKDTTHTVDFSMKPKS